MIELPFPPSINAFNRAIVRGGRAVVITSKKGREYKAACEERLRLMKLPGSDARIAVQLDFYFKARRGDLDNRIKPVLDVLEGHVYANDRQIDELHARRFVDRDNPRVEVQAFELRGAA